MTTADDNDGGDGDDDDDGDCNRADVMLMLMVAVRATQQEYRSCHIQPLRSQLSRNQLATVIYRCLIVHIEQQPTCTATVSASS